LYHANYRKFIKYNNNIDFSSQNEEYYENDEENDNEEIYAYIENNNINYEESEDNMDDDILERLPPLTNENFDFLLNSGVNAFHFGPKIIRLIKNYMKIISLQNDEEFEDFHFENYDDILDEKNKYSLLNKYQIVAMTTTGGAKYSKILENSNFETIIVEEAAEVLESRIVTLLTKNTKRLILIGDHKQLKQKTYNYELGTKYNLNVSLFERLINNKIPFSSLKYQRRMKSIFADFVRIIYGEEDYVDYEDIDNKEKFKGIMNDI